MSKEKNASHAGTIVVEMCFTLDKRKQREHLTAQEAEMREDKSRREELQYDKRNEIKDADEQNGMLLCGS